MLFRQAVRIFRYSNGVIIKMNGPQPKVFCLLNRKSQPNSLFKRSQLILFLMRRVEEKAIRN